MHESHNVAITNVQLNLAIPTMPHYYVRMNEDGNNTYACIWREKHTIYTIYSV